jgi:hypothetical protein
MLWFIKGLLVGLVAGIFIAWMCRSAGRGRPKDCTWFGSD